jgi:hypothetical protein
MKIEDCGGKYGDRLILGLQENESITPEKLAAEVHSKACYWAPPKAKSYTVVEMLNTNYYGTPVEHQTGYFTLILNYFTTVKEGKHKVETPSRDLDSEKLADRRRYEAVLARTQAALVEAAESARAEADRRR